MNLLFILQQALFGGIAALGFGILFNCPPRLLTFCFSAGALALLVRTVGQEGGLALPYASFIAALVLALFCRFAISVPAVAASIITVVGCIPMVPGSLAAQGLKNLFALLQSSPDQRSIHTLTAVENLTIVGATLLAIGAALVLPALLFPQKQKAVA